MRPVGVIAPAEFTDILARFDGNATNSDASPITTTIGEPIQVKGFYADGPKGLRQTVSLNGANASIIIVQSPLLRTLIESEIQSIDGTNLTECVPIADTPLTVIQRASDSFHFSQSESPVELKELFITQHEHDELQPLHHIVLANPLFSASGAITFLHTIASLTDRDPTTITPETLRLTTDTLKKANEQLVQYFFSDQRMLEWMSRQEGGSPLLGVTTAQQYAAFMKRKPDSGLLSHPIVDRGISKNSYYACKVVAPWVSAASTPHVDAVLTYLKSKPFAHMLEQHGFSRPPPIDVQSTPDQSSLVSLFNVAVTHWSDFAKSSSPTIVIDNSISMEGATLERIKGEVSRFIASLAVGSAVSSKKPPVSIISFATKVDQLQRFTTEGISLQQSIQSMRALGGSAARDGILSAVSLFEDDTVPGMRRPVLVFVDGHDTASVATKEELLLTLPALLNRRKVILYVIGIGPVNANYGDIPEVVMAVGGLFKTVDPNKFSEQLSSIWEDLR